MELEALSGDKEVRRNAKGFSQDRMRMDRFLPQQSQDNWQLHSMQWIFTSFFMQNLFEVKSIHFTILILITLDVIDWVSTDQRQNRWVVWKHFPCDNTREKKTILLRLRHSFKAIVNKTRKWDKAALIVAVIHQCTRYSRQAAPAWSVFKCTLMQTEVNNQHVGCCYRPGPPDGYRLLSFHCVSIRSCWWLDNMSKMLDRFDDVSSASCVSRLFRFCWHLTWCAKKKSKLDQPTQKTSVLSHWVFGFK